MFRKQKKFPIGLRTLKTAVAVVISMALVNTHGASTSKLIFAVIGAMNAMAPTFMESLHSCLTQIVGVCFGAIMGILLMELPIPSIVAAGIGILLVITLYNVLRIQFSPVLPSLIIVAICTTTDIQPISYALGRLWDTAIGLGVGFLINTLVFPYNNRKQIRETAKSLDCEVIRFLEEMFDEDDILPDTEKSTKMIDSMDSQLAVFSNQWLLLHMRKNKREYESLQKYERKARQLIAQMEVLCQMEQRGRLDDENRGRLQKFSKAGCIPEASNAGALDMAELYSGETLSRDGSQSREERLTEAVQKAEVARELDIITNYHVAKLLDLRQELLRILNP